MGDEEHAHRGRSRVLRPVHRCGAMILLAAVRPRRA
jgi:hypothetical protein